MMKRAINLLSLVIVTMLIISCRNSDALFLENKNDWFTQGDADWSFSEKTLIGNVDGGAGFIITNQSFKDFVLELEFYPDSTVNSGVFIRCQNDEISASNCYEINIWDLHPNQEYRTGTIVTKTTPLTYIETLNKWNSYTIQIKNGHIQVWLNNILTADYYDQELKEGRIALQAAERGQIMFRNIKILVLNDN